MTPFLKSLLHALYAALFSALLFCFIVAFPVKADIYNQLQIVPQFDYFFNYILISAIGTFVWSYLGRGVKGAIFAFFPAIILFISQRAWLYYLSASATETYSFSEQTLQLLIALFVIALLFILAYCFFYVPNAYKIFSHYITTAQRSLGPYSAFIIIILLLFYPVFIVTLVSDTMAQSQKWIDNYAIQIMIYVMLAWGLSIVVGMAGLLDLGYVAFYAVGSYSVALLGNYFGFSFWLCFPIAAILAALWGIMLGFPLLRLRGDYLAIVTLAFGEIFRIVLQNWTSVTGGANGISVAKASFFGLPFDRSPDGFASFFSLKFQAAHYKIFLYYLILFCLIIMAFIIHRLKHARIGRVLEAMREDEIACRSLGINTITAKLSAFAMGAFFAGCAGAFFAVRQGRADYTSFIFMESVIILSIVVLGGMRSLPAIACAAILMIGGMELFREIPTSLQMIFGPDFHPEQYRMLWFGLALVFIMILKPQGFASKRVPGIFLHKKPINLEQIIKKDRGE